MMLQLPAPICILLASLSLLSCANCSAIKGRPEQPAAKSAAHHVERTAKSVPVSAQPQQQPLAPVVLESSKKVYNDESIRRSVGSQLVGEQNVKDVKAAPVVPQQSAPVVVPVAPVVVAAPVDQQQVAPVAAPVAAPVPVAPIAAVPVAVAETPVPVVEPIKLAAAQAPLPVQPSERSATPVKAEHVAVEPAKEPVVVPVVEVAAAPVQQPQQVQPVVPVVVADSPLQAKKDDAPLVAAPVVVAKEAPVVAEKVEAPPAIEVPAPDPGLVLSEPIDSTTKLLIDLDEHVQKFLPAEDKQEPVQPAKEQVLVSGVDYSPPAAGNAAAAPVEPSGKSSAPLVPYSTSASSSSAASAAAVDESIVPPLPSLEKVEKASGAPQGSSSASSVVGQSATRQGNNQQQNQQQIITQLLDQLDSLQNRIQDTINQLVARRRYVMSALLRPMGTYVRRVRTNLERLQNRVNQLQAAATSIGGNNNQNGQNRPGGFVDAAAIETIRRRIDDISKRISDIVNRIRFSLTPTSAPLHSNGRK